MREKYYTMADKPWSKPTSEQDDDLEELDAPFTVQEIETVIKEMPREKTPGPDGFIGIF